MLLPVLSRLACILNVPLCRQKLTRANTVSRLSSVLLSAESATTLMISCSETSRHYMDYIDTISTTRTGWTIKPGYWYRLLTYLSFFLQCSPLAAYRLLTTAGSIGRRRTAVTSPPWEPATEDTLVLGSSICARRCPCCAWWALGMAQGFVRKQLLVSGQKKISIIVVILLQSIYWPSTYIYAAL